VFVNVFVAGIKH